MSSIPTYNKSKGRSVITVSGAQPKEKSLYISDDEELSSDYFTWSDYYEEKLKKSKLSPLVFWENQLNTVRSQKPKCLDRELFIKLQFAHCYFEMGNLEKAIEIENQVLEIAKVNSGREDFFLLHALSSLAISYSASGDSNKALELAQKAYVIAKKNYRTNNHHCTNFLMNQMSYYLEDLGKYEEAIVLLREVYEYRKENFNNNADETLETLERLANLLFITGQTEEGIKKQEKVYKTRKIVKGGLSNVETRVAMGKLIEYYVKINDLDTAMMIVQQAISETKQSDYWALIDEYSYYAGIFKDSDNIDKAIEIYKKCISIASEHKIDLPVVKALIGECYFLKGKTETALRYLTEANDALLDSDMYREYWVDSMLQTSKCFLSKNRFFDALNILKKVQDEFLIQYGDCEENLVVFYASQSTCYFHLNDITNSILLGEKAYRIAMDSKENTGNLVSYVGNSLLFLYRQNNETDKANQLEQELSKF